MKPIDFNEKREDEEEGGASGVGGQTGEIHFRFRDAASLPPRDDFLPEVRRLQRVHQDLHERLVNHQKLTRKERTALKEGKIHQAAIYQQALGIHRGGIGNLKRHPVSTHPQFHTSTSKNITAIPADLNSETNLEMQQKLEKRYAPKFVPKSTPTFRPSGF